MDDSDRNFCAEVHLPFDRLAIAYRRRLREIGFAMPGGAVRSDAAAG